MEIVNQHYPGDDSFVNRIRNLLGYLKEPGSRAAEASFKRERSNMESEEKTAKRILSFVGEVFGVSEKDILKMKGFRGEVGRARSMVLYLLHENLPWSYTELAAYLGLKNKSGIDYHLRKVKKNGDLRKILGKIYKKGKGVI